MFSNLTLFIQNKENTVTWNTDDLFPDSVIHIVSDNEVSLNQKYKVISSIANFRDYELLVPVYTSTLSITKPEPNDSIQMQLHVKLLEDMVVKAEMYNCQKSYALAIDEGLNALDFIHIYDNELVGDRYNYILHRLYILLSKAYKGIGNYEKAYKYKELESELTQIILDKKKYKAIKEMEAKYHTEAKEREIQALHEYNKYRVKAMCLLISIIVLLIIILFIIYYKLRLK